MKKILIAFAFLMGAFFMANAKTNKEFVIVIQAGHGGADAGAKAADGTLEKELTLAYAKELQKLAGENNFRIVMCREDDTDFDLSQRPDFAKQYKADLFIILHFNMDAANAGKRGFECFVATQGNVMENKVLGKFMGAELHNTAGIKFNGVNTHNMLNLSLISVPVALLNLGYMSSESDMAVIKTEEGKKEICQKILNAIIRYKAHFEAN